MAERNRMREARPDEVQDRDPFADLARIIGFDPRVKLQPSNGATLLARAGKTASPAALAAEGTASRQFPARPDTPASPAAGQTWEDEFSDLDFGLSEGSGANRDAEVPDDVGASGDAAPPASPSHALSASPITGALDSGDIPAFELAAAVDVAAEDRKAGWAQQSQWTDAPVEIDGLDIDLDLPVDEADLRPAAAEPLASEAHGAAADDLHPDDHLDHDLLLDTDLDDVLAASIERDLGDTWLRSEDDLEAETSHSQHHTDPVSGVNEEPPLEAPLPARSEALVAVDVQASAAPEAGVAEPDFESELAAFLKDDEVDQAPAPVALVAAASKETDDVSAPVTPSIAATQSADEVDGASAPELPAVAEGISANPVAGPPEPRRAAPQAIPAPPARLPAADAPVLDDDPFAALAAMAARYRAAQFEPNPALPQPAPHPTQAQETQEIAEVEEMERIPPARHETPEIETVDVPEHAVALVDDLDFPDLPYEQPETRQSRRAEVDAEFADLLEEMSTGETSRHQPSRTASPRAHSDARFEARQQPQPAYHDYEPRTASQRLPQPSARPAVDAEDDWQPQSYAMQPSVTDDEDPFYDDEGLTGIADEDMHDAPPKPRKRGKWLAALFGSVVIVGGAGALAMKFTGAVENAGPVLVKADANPIKIRPENPGGIVVPNQENEVYERVAGGASAAPAQEKLLSSAEVPVSLDEAAAEDELMPSFNIGDEVGDDLVPAKSEERVAEDVQGEPEPQAPIAVTPRKVKTMVVRADGTLVEREEATPAVETLVASAGDALDIVRKGSAGVDMTGSTASVKADPAPVEPTAANTAPAETPAVPGAWSVQIASQPSEEAARSSYADLARRYAAVLSGRDVNIVKADVSGKGTFWRVRVPAETRSAAVDLCTNYKAAGGNCFVSK